MEVAARTIKPSVSILMPIFNAEAYLRDAIGSLQAQTFEDWELIAVLDGCTDASESILNEFADPRIRVVSLASNRGVAHALNRGLQECACELVARFDSDDLCQPTRLARQIAVLMARPSLGALGTSAILVDHLSAEIGLRSVRRGVRRVQAGLLIRNQLIHPSVAFRRSIVIAAGGYDERAGIAQDYELWLRVLCLSEIDNLEDPLISYRLHPGQNSRSSIFRRETLEVVGRSRRKAVEHVGLPGLTTLPLHALWILGQVRREILRSATLRGASHRLKPSSGS